MKATERTMNLFSELPISPTIYDHVNSKNQHPLLSVVIPTMNEEISISEFIEWVYIGFERAGISGELIILDSSDDRTPEIAWNKGARVLRLPRNGLGHAYRSAGPFVRGKYIILGDADCTYDFREIAQFVGALEGGFDFVMGSRFKGVIEKGSMPFLHQYFGTPFTTWLVRKLHHLDFSDIHCGMRAMTTKIYQMLPFDEPGWEYAPEMVITASVLSKNVTEVPVNFFKEPEGRVSHFRRGKRAWMSPIKAGIGSIRVTLVHALDQILVSVGFPLFAFGSIASTVIAINPITIGNQVLGIGTQIFASLIALMGFYFVFLGYLVKRIFLKGSPSKSTISKHLSFNRTSIAFFVCSIFVAVQIVIGIQECTLSQTCFIDDKQQLLRYSMLSLYVWLISFGLWISALMRSYLDYESTFPKVVE